MKRRLFTILSASALLLFVAVCVMWFRGYFRDDACGWYADDGAGEHWTVGSGQGGVWLRRTDGERNHMLEGFTSRSIPDWEHPELTGVILNRAPRRVSKGFFGFWTYYRARGATVAQAQFWGVPYWFLFALSAPVPLMTAARWHLRRRRQDTGRCHSCGYDLRATPGRCPECGAIARPPAATTEKASGQ